MDNNINIDVINKLKKILYENMSYTNQDYTDMIVEMINIVQSGKLPTQWNNLTETDPIMLLFSLFAAHKDILNYMIDYRVMESYMSTAKERASLVRIANSYGYKIPSYSSARIQYTIDKNLLPDNTTLKLNPFTEIVDANNVSWTYVGEQKTLVQEDDELTIDLYQGVPNTVEFEGISIDPITKTKVMASTNVALSNVWDTTAVVELTYGSGAEKFTYTNLTQNVEQHDRIFDMDVDTTNMTYIKFVPTLPTTGDYSGTFKLKYINTAGETNITPQQTIEIPLINVDTDEIVKAEATNVINSYKLGKNPATADEIKQGFKTFYAGIKSLVTVKDYANYILNVQKVVPDVSKVFVLDNQTDSGGGSGSLDIDDLTVAIAATRYDESLKKHVALTSGTQDDEQERLLADLKLHKITGVVTEMLPVSGVTVNIEVEGNILGGMQSTIEDTIKNYLIGVNIGSTITTKELTNLLVEKDLLKYFEFGSTIKFGTSPLTSFKHILNYDEFIDEVTIVMVGS